MDKRKIERMLYLKEVKKKTYKEIGEMETPKKTKQWAGNIITRELRRIEGVNKIIEMIENGDTTIYKVLDLLVNNEEKAKKIINSICKEINPTN